MNKRTDRELEQAFKEINYLNDVINEQKKEIRLNSKRDNSDKITLNIEAVVIISVVFLVVVIILVRIF